MLEQIRSPRVSCTREELDMLMSAPGMRDLLRGVLAQAAEPGRPLIPAACNPRLLTACLLLGGLMAHDAKAALLEAADAGSAEARAVLRSYIGTAAVYPGSFDPFTRGHRDLVERALKIFDEVIVAVGANPGKNPLFTPGERVALIEQDLARFGAAVRVVQFTGTLVDFCTRENCAAVVRGVRSLTDWEDELRLARYNFDESQERIETLMMPAREGGSYVSSSMVKQLLTFGRSVADFISPDIEKAIRAKLNIPGDGSLPQRLAADMHMLARVLRLQWLQACEALGAESEAALGAFDRVLEHWNGDGRAHHTLQHLYEMVETIERANPGAENKALLILAAAGHDLVYDTRRKDNEEASIAAFVPELRALSLPAAVTERVADLIAATAGHLCPAQDYDKQLFLDADLAILGAAWPRYRRYARDIYNEYCQVGLAAYCAGRSSFLEGMLQRTIFQTESMRTLFEAEAHENMRRELALLKSCPEDFLAADATPRCHLPLIS